MEKSRLIVIFQPNYPYCETKLKIAVVTPWYGYFAGGAEVLAKNVAKNLKKVGYIVEILTTCSKSPFDNWWDDYYIPGVEEDEGMRIRRFAVNKEHQDNYHKINSKLIHKIPINRSEELEYLEGSISSDDLIAFAESHKSDYVFLIIPYLFGLSYWLFNAVPDRCLLIPCLHDEPQAYFSTTIQMLENCPIFFNTPEECKLSKKICNISDSSFIVSGVGLDECRVFKKEQFFDKYKINYPYLLYAGRKDKGKNVDKIIDFFLTYKERNQDNLILVFIGGGDDSLIPTSEYFFDLGYVSEEDKFNAYSGALATILLSDNESFSYVLMESWLASRPVIVSDSCPVTKGHCIRSNGGLFIHDVDEFCDVIQYLINYPLIGEKMGVNGKKYVKSNYSWDNVIMKYKVMIESHIRGLE